MSSFYIALSYILIILFLYLFPFAYVVCPLLVDMYTGSCSRRTPLILKICQHFSTLGLIGLTNCASILWPKHVLGHITYLGLVLGFWIALLGFSPPLRRKNSRALTKCLMLRIFQLNPKLSHLKLAKGSTKVKFLRHQLNLLQILPQLQQVFPTLHWI